MDPLNNNSDDNFTCSEIEEYLKGFVFTEEEDSEYIKLYKELENKYQPQVIASLERNNVNLHLQGEEITMDWSSPNIELTEKRYLASKVLTGLIELDSGSDDLIIEAIVMIGANHTISTDDKERYYEAIHDILGTEVYNNISVKINDYDLIDEIFQKEAQISKLNKYSFIVGNIVESFLKKAGVSPSHDDYDLFCRDFTRLVIMYEDVELQNPNNPVYARLRSRIHRLGIENKIDELWRIFDLEDD